MVRLLRLTLPAALFLVACGGDDSSGGASAVGAGGAAGGAGSSCVDTGERPGPRGEMAGVFDTKRARVVFFGGDSGLPKMCNPAPHPLGELWTYDTACKGFSEVVGAMGPGPRTRSVAALDVAGDRMLVFGGRYRAGMSGAYTLYGDVWALDLETLAWTQVDTGTGPSARSSAAADLDAKTGELVVVGGNTSTDGLSFVPQIDVWAFDPAKASWRAIAATGAAPPKRQFHAATVDAKGRRLFVYSGGDAKAFTGPFLRDLWSFDLDSGVWTQLSSGEGPLARISASLSFDEGSASLLLFGGHDDGAVGNQNDTWRFDLTAGTWSEITAPETVKTPSGGFCDFPKDFTQPNLAAPDRRSAHLATFDAKARRLRVFGGKTDCGLIDDAWTFDAEKSAWSRDVASTYGEACVRTPKGDACSSLCQ